MLRQAIRVNSVAGMSLCAQVCTHGHATQLSELCPPMSSLSLSSSSLTGSGVSSVGLLSPSRPLQRGFAEDRQTVDALRQKLKRQIAERAQSFDVFDTESRLALALAQSRVLNEKLEALQRGEDLWDRLEGKPTQGADGQSNYVQLPSSSRTAMRMTITTSMRRCALQCGRKEVAETWTRRFVEKRRNISFDDFDSSYDSQGGQGDPSAGAATASVAGSQQLNSRPRRDASTGSGNQFYMGEEYDDEEEQGAQSSSSGSGSTTNAKATGEGNEDGEAKQKQKKASATAKKMERPVDRMRHEMMLEHPMIDIIHKRRPTPGPRYTGS